MVNGGNPYLSEDTPTYNFFVYQSSGLSETALRISSRSMFWINDFAQIAKVLFHSSWLNGFGSPEILCDVCDKDIGISSKLDVHMKIIHY